MGVGTAKRVKAVRWGTAKTIVTAWVLTIPLSAVVAGVTHYVYTLLF
jgi:PiT family inorganic phosphate transporter